MKKLLLVTLSLMNMGAAFALPLGNPSEASLLGDGMIVAGGGDPACPPWCNMWSLRLGFYGDYVYNRHLERESPDKEIERLESATNAGYLAFNLFDRLDIFSTFGTTSFSLSTNSLDFVTPGFAFLTNGPIVLETEGDFSWSVGAHATLWQWGCTTLGVEGQYFFARPRIRAVYIDGMTPMAGYPDSHIAFKYQEWQAGIGLSHRIQMFIPYVGVKWAHAQAKLGNAQFFPTGAAPFSEVTLPNLENSKVWGYAFGVSIVAWENTAVTLEGRLGDEKAFYINGEVRF